MKDITVQNITDEVKEYRPVVGKAFKKTSTVKGQDGKEVTQVSYSIAVCGANVAIETYEVVDIAEYESFKKAQYEAEVDYPS